jgi:hypothetical protein
MRSKYSMNAFLAVAHAGVMLTVLGAGVAIDRCSGLVLVEHQLVERDCVRLVRVHRLSYVFSHGFSVDRFRADAGPVGHPLVVRMSLYATLLATDRGGNAYAEFFEVERRRGWLLADWLCREAAVSWLQAAGARMVLESVVSLESCRGVGEDQESGEAERVREAVIQAADELSGLPNAEWSLLALAR